MQGLSLSFGGSADLCAAVMTPHGDTSVPGLWDYLPVVLCLASHHPWRVFVKCHTSPSPTSCCLPAPSSPLSHWYPSEVTSLVLLSTSSAVPPQPHGCCACLPSPAQLGQLIACSHQEQAYNPHVAPSRPQPSQRQRAPLGATKQYVNAIL